MAHFPRKFSLAAGCALALALVHVAAVAAAEGAAGDPVQKADLDLQALKADALAVSREIAVDEQKLLFPDQSRASFYIGVKVPGFLLDDISIRINENEPVKHSYTDSESRAFLKEKGLHRLLRLKLEPGSYRLQGTWTGHFYDARPDEAPVKGTVETVFEKGLSDIDMVLPISRNSRLDRPGLSEVARLESRKMRPSRNVWLPGPQQYDALKADRGVLDDPRYRFAQFLKEDGRYLSALTELADIEESWPEPEKLPAEFQLLFAECYLDFGMEARAQERYERVAAGPHDAADFARAQIQLARFDYQRGYHDKALARIDGVKPDDLPDDVADDRRLVQTSALLAMGRYKDAADVLAARGDDLSPVLRYNFAVALAHSGRPDDARKQLDILGSMDVSDIQTLVLRDKANLSLGYQYLQAQQGAAARTVFGRIRASGPFSNHALLGMGWAEVADATQQPAAEATESKGFFESVAALLRPGYVDPKATVKSDQPVKGLSPREQQGLLRALVPWVELTKRDPMDPAVQEGFLAIPWALDRLQDYTQSLARYQSAITALETARKRMDEAARSIKGGRMVETIVRRDVDAERGWMWKLRDLPDAPETYFLQTLLAENRFQEMIKNLRDARLLGRSVDAWATRLDAIEKAAAGSAAAERPLARARKGWHPDWTGTIVWLNLETSLGAPGTYDAPIKVAAATPFALQTLDAPQAFNGRHEALSPLRAKLDALKPRAGAVGTAEDDLLEAMSLRELEGQKKTIERYLTEARFAVARIYDRQSQGGR